MTAIEFFRETEKHLNKMAKSKDIRDLSKYYHCTDYYPGSVLNNFSDKAQVFAQIALHAQNATMISNIVRFEKNIDFLSKVTYNFDPIVFSENYPKNDLSSVNRLVETLRFNPENNLQGLKWNTHKSTKHKDAIITRYANTLIETADFIKRFKSRDEFREKLILEYTPQKSPKKLINYFRNNIKSGYSVALTCDFLKEFDEMFCDLPKPDVHIKDVMIAYYGLKDNAFNTEKREFDCILKMQQLTSEINEYLELNERITVYQLDRMIWLICTGDFYLDSFKNCKADYINAIRK